MSNKYRVYAIVGGITGCVWLLLTGLVALWVFSGTHSPHHPKGDSLAILRSSVQHTDTMKEITPIGSPFYTDGPGVDVQAYYQLSPANTRKLLEQQVVFKVCNETSMKGRVTCGDGWVDDPVLVPGVMDKKNSMCNVVSEKGSFRKTLCIDKTSNIAWLSLAQFGR